MTVKSVDRLVTFTDAVVAIAITLLVLPLAELVHEAAARHETSWEVISKNQSQIFSFLLSFVVIARLWVAHHHIFEPAESYNDLLIVVNLGWLLTIVVLPFPTDMIAEFRSDRFTVGFYIGTMLVSVILQVLLILTLKNSPGLMRNSNSLDQSLRRAANTAVAMVVALIIGESVPGGTLYGLLLLPVPDIIDRIRRTSAAE
jgi:uncharacterized membrane protein